MTAEEPFVDDLPVFTTTMDEDGNVVDTKMSSFVILNAPAGHCWCGKAHAPEVPHDACSLRYQYAFYGKHLRWPCWADAMAHCDDVTKQRWTALLEERGVDVNDPAKNYGRSADGRR